MCRGHFQAACTELNIHIAVLNHRNHASHQGHNDLLPTQPLVLRVFGIDAHGRVAHDGLRSCGGHNGIVALVVAVDDGSFRWLYVQLAFGLNIVFQVVELRMFLFVDHFLGRQGGESLGVPVHHAQVAIDVAFAIEVDKHLDDALRAGLVHGESRAVPVAGGTQAPQLFQDNASVLMRPGPGMLKELLASEVVLLYSLRSQLLHNLGFSGYRCVVGARYPTGILALHACPAHQNVLYGVVQHVAHVQHTCHIGRRNDDSVRLTSVGL